MKKQNSNPEDAARLRQKAEEQLKLRKSETNKNVSETDKLKLIQELQVHQIELELQNEELVTAKEKAELAEEKYTSLFDFAPTAYFNLTPNGDISELNLAGAKMLGKERQKLVNNRLSLFISRDTRAVFDDLLSKVLMGKSPASCEVTFVNGGDAPIYAHLSGTIADDGKHCLITAVDITERKQAELVVQKKGKEIAAQNEELNQANLELIAAKKTAEESDRLKSAFLANMSHEIRTPMNGILGFAELLKEPDLKSENRDKYIGIIEKSGARMLNIINQIVGISKIEAGLTELDINESNIAEQIEYVYTFFKPEAEAKRINLSYTNPLSTKEAIIKTDREKLYAILTNLVKNALKYTEKGSIELGYNLKTRGESNVLEFYVKDTGIGIPKDRQEAIFERFIQADIADRMAYQGAGLGLAISKAYVEMLGGEIWVESEEGKGATFYFTLPYKTDHQETDAQNVDELTIEKEDQVKNLKILIVEDDEFSAMLMSEYVQPIGREILQAGSGTEAVKICKNHPDIDLILMDIKMSDMGGKEATRQIRNFNKDVVIIAQTAKALSDDRSNAMDVGCNDYIAKPISKTELQALIQKYFGKG